MFTACLYVFLVCPAEMLPTLWLKTVRSDYVRSVMFNRPVFFQVWLLSVAGLSRGGVLVLTHHRTARFSRLDGNSAVQDGKCNQEAIEIHDRMVSRRAEPQSGRKVMEGWRNIKNV